jgi:hypothetical protein
MLRKVGVEVDVQTPGRMQTVQTGRKTAKKHNFGFLRIDASLTTFQQPHSTTGLA